MLLIAIEGVLLVGGTVHPMTPDGAPSQADVWIEDGRIRAVGAELDAPPEVRRIDVSGRHLLPGLCDAMVHHDAEHDLLYVLAGVTLVRDLGGDTERLAAARAPGARDLAPGPELLSAVRILDGAPPITTGAVVLADEDEVAGKLERLLELEPDFLTYHLGLRREPWRATLEFAQDEGLPLWGPVAPHLDLAEILAAGQDGLFYLDGLLPPGRGWDDATDADLDEAVRRAAASDVAITPLALLYTRLVAQPPAEEELTLLGPLYARRWHTERARWDGARTAEGALARTRAAIERQGGLLRDLAAAGVALVPGSAAPNPGSLPGLGLHAELAAWERAGMTTDAILQAATRVAAEELGQGETRGTLEAGKVADVLVVAQDPRADLATLRRPELVVLRGHVLDAARLAEMRAGLVDAQARRRAAAEEPIDLEPLELPEGELVLAGRAQKLAQGVPFAAERFAVLRGEDDEWIYVGEMRTPQTTSFVGTRTRLEQRLAGRRLRSFRLLISAGEDRTVEYIGVYGAGRFAIEMRTDGTFTSRTTTPRPLTVVDAGSVTTLLALYQHHAEGPFNAIFFEGLTPAATAWHMTPGPEPGEVRFDTHAGFLRVTYDDQGIPRSVERREGAGSVLTHVEADELDLRAALTRAR